MKGKTMTKNLLNTVFARRNANTGLWDVRVDGQLVKLNYRSAAAATREGNKLARARMAAQVDPHAATRAEGRRMGMTDAQIDRFIARMS